MRFDCAGASHRIRDNFRPKRGIGYLRLRAGQAAEGWAFWSQLVWWEAGRGHRSGNQMQRAFPEEAGSSLSWSASDVPALRLCLAAAVQFWGRRPALPVVRRWRGHCQRCQRWDIFHSPGWRQSRSGDRAWMYSADRKRDISRQFPPFRAFSYHNTFHTPWQFDFCRKKPPEKPAALKFGITP